MVDVFISYHMKSTGGLVQKIAKSLENSGIVCWYAERNKEVGDFAIPIPKAINECRVFLLILDEGANNSPHVLSEVALAFERKGKGLTIVPFKIGQFQICDTLASYYLKTTQIFNAGNSPEREIVRCIKPMFPSARKGNKIRTAFAAVVFSILAFAVVFISSALGLYGNQGSDKANNIPSDYPKVISLTEDVRKRINIYLSNFSEQRFSNYDPSDYCATIEFVRTFFKINRDDIQYRTYHGINCEMLSLNDINTYLDRFFNFQISNDNAIRSAEHSDGMFYENGTFYFTTVDEKPYNAFTVVDDMQEISENTYKVHFYICELDLDVYLDSGISQKCYQMDIISAQSNSTVNIVAEGSATLKGSTYRKRPDYHLLSYSVSYSDEPSA